MPAEPKDESPEVDEEELIQAARDGSHRAFGVLVERYQNRLYRFILERVGNREDAEDILQTTFVTAYRKLDSYRSEYRFSTWMFTLAYRRSVDRLRRRRAIPAEAAMETVSDTHPADAMESEEVRERLWGLARRVLSERQHALLWLRYGEDLDLLEIATVTGLSRTHIKVLLYRARQILGRHLASLNEESESTRPRVSANPNERERAWLRHSMTQRP